MIIFDLALRNLRLNRRRTLLSACLIALCVVIAIIGNSFFESSVVGLKKTFIDCFTGDLFVSPSAERPLSLFGEDTPVIGSYAPIATLSRQDEIRDVVNGHQDVAKTASQLSGYVLLEYRGSRTAMAAFGVDGDDYFHAFNSIRMAAGSLLKTEKPGVLISRKTAQWMHTATGHEPVPGDPVQLSVFTSHGFSIREAPIAGIFEFPTSNSVLDRILYVDAGTLRALNGMSQGMMGEIPLPEEATRYLEGDLENVFSADTGKTADVSGIRLSEVEKAIGQERKLAGEDAAVKASWSYILIKIRPGADANSVKKDLDALLRSRGLAARIGDWRAAAGSGAAIAGSLSLAFNMGLGMLGIVIVLILANSFITVVIERTSEVATMRALGAPKRFVRRMFLGEAAILSAAAGAVGVVIGSIAVASLHRRGFATDNRILAMIFGGNTLRPLLTLRTVAGAFVGAVLIGGTASLFAVRLALRIRPAHAMEGE